MTTPLIPLGIALAPAEQIAQRMTICRGCEWLGHAPVLKTEYCKRCGCPLATKTKFSQSHCPLEKW
jgi:uncharacterized paraquat-inducible protein A